MKKSNDYLNLLEDASLCVKCGLCLPHCPSYQLTQDENESPRGRISLIQGLVSKQLPLNAKLEKHLDQCLSCRHCERVCPANVPYGTIIDHSKVYIKDHALNKSRHSTYSTSIINLILKYRKLRNLLGYILWLYQKTGLQWLIHALKLSKLFGLSRLESLIPTMKRPLTLKSYYPAKGTSKGKVGLFIGCMSDWSDVTTLRAGIFALQTCGFEVYIPLTQGCCGALALHSGDAIQSKLFQINNEKSFSKTNLDTIIHMVSGCGATLKEYQNSNFNHNVSDISHFLIKHLPENLKPIQAKILLHTPCTLKNVCKEGDAPLSILQAIPGLNIIPFSNTSHCCGAAGAYMINHPDLADALAEKILKELSNTDAEYLVTSNIGCALHLHAALKRQGRTLKIVHPIYFLAQALGQGQQ